MAQGSDASPAFTNERRRAIGRVCSLGPRTVGDLSRQLGSPDGALRKAIEGLLEDGGLLPAKAPHSHAAAFRLSAKGRRELRRAVKSLAPPGLLTPGQDLFLISIEDLDELGAELVNAEGWPGLVWLGRLYGGPFGALAAFDADASSEERDAFARRLRKRKVAHWQLRLDWVKDPPELASWALTSGAGPRPELTSGG